MKQFAAWFTHGVANGAHLRKAIYESPNEAEIIAAVDRFFEPRLSSGVAQNGSTEASAVEEPVLSLSNAPVTCEDVVSS